MLKLKALLLTQGMHGMISQAEGLSKALGLSFKHQNIRLKGYWNIIPPKLTPISDIILEEKFICDSKVIISCGGGVIGDVCALAASLYLRGLIYFHTPTTMTAIVDSCIGGKTGINYKNIINSLGNYYHPRTVFISKNVIDLIPRREFLAGIPEIIKSGMIDNNIILKMLINNKQKFLSRDFSFISKLIYFTLKTKIKFFKNDVYETSKRLNLNFGQ